MKVTATIKKRGCLTYLDTLSFLCKNYLTSLLRKSLLLNINMLYLYSTNMDAYIDR